MSQRTDDVDRARQKEDQQLRDSAEALGATPAAAAAEKIAILEDLAPFEALHLTALVAELSAPTLPSDAGIPRPSPTVCEYFASILLARTSPDGEQPPRPAPEVRSAAQAALIRIERLTGRSFFAKLIQSGLTSAPFARLVVDRELRDIVFRWPNYPDQEEALLAELFSSAACATALRHQLGFDAEQALRMYRALTEITVVKRQVHAALHEQLLEAHARTDAVLGALPVDDRRLLALGMRLGPDLVDAWTCSELELAAAAGVRWQVARSFRERLTTGFGATRGLHLVAGRNRVRSRPLIPTGPERSLTFSLDGVLRAIRPMLEDALPPGLFQGAYQSARATWLEDVTVEALASLLPGSQVYRNVRFDLDGDENLEIDILLRCDHLIFVIEAKAGTVDPEEGGRAFKNSVEEILGHGSRQSGRLALAMAQGRTPDFRSHPSGEPVHVDLTGVRRAYPIVITLDDVGFLATRGHSLVDAGLRDPQLPWPWVVSIFDLQVICETAGHPAELTTFVDARRRLDQRVLALDELELWFLHQAESLDMVDVPGGLIMLEGRVAVYDDHRLLGRPEPPGMPLQPSDRRLLADELGRADQDWLWRCEAILQRARADRRPAHWPSPIPELSVCAPSDPRSRPGSIADYVSGKYSPAPEIPRAFT
ncbi:MAG: NERD domain-containing protein [Actinomycetota bacterium]|nr:NERD domain-containing protein [Actinomycetota bacterium]